MVESLLVDLNYHLGCVRLEMSLVCTNKAEQSLPSGFCNCCIYPNTRICSYIL